MQENKLSAPFLVFLLSLLFCQFYTPAFSQVEVSFPKVDQEPLSAIPEGAIILYDGWQMKESSIIGMNGEKISSAGFKPVNWYPTAVPTTWLNLDGINYRADVWINGKLVADSTELVGMFKRFRLNIPEYINPGKINVRAIAIHQLDFPGDPVSEQLGSLKGDFGPNSGDGEILRNVTQYITIGWDWIPAVRDRNIGIWQHVSINATGPVAVADPAAFTVVNRSGVVTADLTIRIFVSNSLKINQSVDLLVNIQNPGKTQTVASISHHLNLEAESRREIILKPRDYDELTLKNPDLWWPVNYGDQPLYHLDVVARIDGQLSSKAASRFGVREVSSYILQSGWRAGEESATCWDAHPKKCDSTVFMDNMVDFISRARGQCSIFRRAMAFDQNS